MIVVGGDFNAEGSSEKIVFIPAMGARHGVHPKHLRMGTAVALNIYRKKML